MNKASHDDLIHSHRVLNYLSAAYQARFAFLNILSQLDHPMFQEEEIEVTKKGIQTVNGWLDQLWNGYILFSSNVDKDGREVQKHALTMLNALKPELNSLALKMKKILLEEDFHSNPDDVGLLLASYGRYVYGQENYVRGISKFGHFTNDEALVDQYTRYNEELTKHVQLVGQYLKTYRQGPEKKTLFYKQLLFSCRILPGVFRSREHDIIQMIAGPYSKLNFVQAGFLDVEAHAWHGHGYTAVEAGYWRAHNISADEAEEWVSAEVADPLVAASWRTAGYAPAEAAEWIAVFFDPLLAIQWSNSQYAPKEAAILVSQGYALPSDVPEGEEEQIIQDALDELVDTQKEMEQAEKDRIRKERELS